MILALSAVEATLWAALIGALAGIGGGIAGQLAGASLARRNQLNARQLDDLIRLQDRLTELNRLHYRVIRHWRPDTTDSTVPGELWEDFVATRGEVLALNERILQEDLAAVIRGLREGYAIQPRPPFVESERARLDTCFENAQKLLGKAVRERL